MYVQQPSSSSAPGQSGMPLQYADPVIHIALSHVNWSPVQSVNENGITVNINVPRRKRMRRFDPRLRTLMVACDFTHILVDITGSSHRLVTRHV